MKKSFVLSCLATTLLSMAILNAHASCGSTFCSVNTHWDTQGMVNDGLRVDLRYTYARADTPRVGTNKVTNDPALAAPGDEVENLRTVNQSLNIDFDYAIDHQWNIAVDVPLVMRDHAHTIAPDTVEQRKFTELGDIRVAGSYKFGRTDHATGSGLRFGLKLPTGRTNWELVPGAGQAERSLQPGTGSTDAILGIYHHEGVANTPWGWFVSGQVQTALTSHDGYRPGNTVNLDAGASYILGPSVTGLLQLNAQFNERDSGVNANPHSGGRSISLGPGLGIAVAPQTKLYGLVQLPIYQYANPDPAGGPSGLLTAPWSLSLGISQMF
ncbi:MAG: hypothetical protein AB1513_08075 [Pseudomonadota bacterium]